MALIKLAPGLPEFAARQRTTIQDAGPANNAPTLPLYILAFFGAMLHNSANSATVLPDFGAATFNPGQAINNSYFPLADSKTQFFVSDDGSERFEFKLVGPGPEILSVQTTSRRDRAFEDDLLVEDTFDYFAQDTAGNVWYLGEDVTNYNYDANGKLLSKDTKSSWRAGENFANPGGSPAQPGFIMPALAAALTDGFNYYQEFAADDEALDEGTQFLPLVNDDVPFGKFTKVLRVLETTAVEPGNRAFKYYAPGVGLIKEEEGLDEEFGNPELTFERVTAIPVPGTFWLFGVGLAGLGLLRHKKSAA